MSIARRTYLALGDSMSIDDYTGVTGGGAANQFFRTLGEGWEIDDRTLDGCCMGDVPVDAAGEVITLTIGGNDLLWKKDEYLARGLAPFANEHLQLLEAIRKRNPQAVMIVGDVYHPDAVLSERERESLQAANRVIHSNCLSVGAEIAPIYRAFRGHEKEYLCLQIEPTLRGAEAIAELFRAAFKRATAGGRNESAQ